VKVSDLTNWRQYWQQLRTALLSPKVDEAALEQLLRQARERMPVPVLWLLGKTQAGKTSIIRALTGSEAAEIGNGFQPCTRTARLYDFPSEMPVVRFLDTRGLGEVAYDPDEDIRYCESQAHLVIAVMKAADIRQDAVIEVLKAVRRRHPDWPLLIVQTGLHELYSVGDAHILPYLYDEKLENAAIPPALSRALRAQRAFVAELAGDAPVCCIAVDLTLPEDELPPADYGLDALWQAIEELSPISLRKLLSGDENVRDLYARSAHPHILAYSLAAAGVGALPLVDLFGVVALQAKLLHALAALYGYRWDRRTVSEFTGLLGTGIATGLLSRMVGRSLVKLVPVWGQTVGAVWGASASGATTYALGKAAVYFFAARNAGQSVDPQLLRRIYAESLSSGAALLKQRIRRTENP